MAISLLTFTAASVDDLAVQISGALATLTDRAILRVDFSALDPFIGYHYRAVLTLAPSVTTLSSPFHCTATASSSLGEVVSSLGSIIATFPAYFFGAPLIASLSSNRFPSQHAGLLFFTSDAAGGAANWEAGSGGALMAANNLSDVADANLARVNLNQGHATVVDGIAPVIDFSKSDALEWTLGASRNAPAASGMKAGGTYLLQLKQGGAGTNLVTWDPSWVWPNATPPTLQTALGAVDIITGYYDGTKLRVSAGAGWLS